MALPRSCSMAGAGAFVMIEVSSLFDTFQWLAPGAVCPPDEEVYVDTRPSDDEVWWAQMANAGH